MIKIYFILVINLFFTLFLKAQNYEFYGVLKLNGKTENAISYRLVFAENNGKIIGYSITDITGNHETKNIIEGSYNPVKKLLKFKEQNIIYTKSPISDDLFCFVNFEGKVNLSSKSAKLDGIFNGRFSDQTKCIDGTLTLISQNKVNNLLNKANKKIQKSKELDTETKRKYNPIQIFDSLKTNQLMAAQDLKVFMKSAKAKFEIWDNGIEDGDMINFYQNGKIILERYVVKKIKNQIEVNLSENINIFKIEALNEGSNSPNTAMIVLVGDKTIDFQSTLKKGEHALVTIIKN